jgi:hypothetical protein
MVGGFTTEAAKTSMPKVIGARHHGCVAISRKELPMAESKSLPAGVVAIPTYAELEHYAHAFAAGHLTLLILCGAPGLGKSQCLRRALAGKVCWIDGNASAFGVYLQAYEHRHQPLVLDDIDGLHGDRRSIRLLKALCQTDMVKTVCWQTAAARPGQIPRQFSTTSRVVIIANEWKALNADVAALEDRGHCLHFAPSALEVHRHSARWFWDQEIFDFVGAHLHLFMQPSLRSYVLAWELKRAGLNWREPLLGRCLTGAALAVAKFKANPSFASEEARVRAFVAAGLGCRASYFNAAKKLKPQQATPAIKLTHSSPEEPTPNVDFLDSLRRRFGPLGNG